MLDQRLPLTESFGTTAHYQFKTYIQELRDGRETRIVNWNNAIAKFEINAKYVVKGLSNPVVTASELNDLISFHQQVRGRWESFRFKDYNDFQAFAYPRQVFLDEVEVARVQGVLGDNGDGTYQLAKSYTIVQDGVLYTVHRPITRPVISDIELFDSSANPVTGTVQTNGKVVSSSSPALWRGTFDVPVRFEQDEISYQFQSHLPSTGEILFSIDSISLVEVREPFGAIPGSSYVSSDHLGLFDFPFQSNVSPSFETLLTKSDSGYESRDSTRTDSRISLELAERDDYSEDDIQYLICLFRYCRGSGVPFYVPDRFQIKGESPLFVRFENDTLSISFTGYNPYAIPSYFYSCSFSVYELLPQDSFYFLARCWKIEKNSGTLIGFTTLDSPLFIDALSYWSIGFDPTEIVANNEASVDSSEFSSFFDVSGISLVDMHSGEYAGAFYTRFIYDFSTATTLYTELNGFLGKRTSTDRVYQIEGRSLSQKLQQKREFKTRSLCWKQLGSQGPGQCKVDLNLYTYTGLISSVTDLITFVTSPISGSGSLSPDFFAEGKVIINTGVNAGYTFDIKRSSVSSESWTITLWEAPYLSLEVGSEIQLVAGCNKTRVHCQKKFNNFHNFGGEPSLPGNNQYIAGALNSTNLDDD